MIWALGYGDRDLNLFRIIDQNSTVKVKFIDYRLFFTWYFYSGQELFVEELDWKKMHSKSRFVRFCLRFQSRMYMNKFIKLFSRNDVILLPGKHRLWEWSAFHAAKFRGCKVLFYEAADKEHIYLSKTGVCGEAELVEIPTSSEFVSNTIFLRYKWKWVVALFKIDSGEFWRAIKSRLWKFKALERQVDFKVINNSILFLGQVPWDLNSLIYGISVKELKFHIANLANALNIEHIYYKPHPLYFDSKILYALREIPKVSISVVNRDLTEDWSFIKACMSINSNGLLEFKKMYPQIESIALGRFLYKDLFKRLDDIESTKRAEFIDDYLSNFMVKCDYRTNLSYIDKKLINYLEDIHK